jgi:hypothetical protein
MSETPYLTPGVDESGPGLMQRAASIVPYARYVPKNPAILIGAAVLGVVGVLAWRNRAKIAATTRPLLQNAAAKGQELVEHAKAKGEELVETAKSTGETLAAKAKSIRGGGGEVPAGGPDLH